jgi:hypothetical protein
MLTQKHLADAKTRWTPAVARGALDWLMSFMIVNAGRMLNPTLLAVDRQLVASGRGYGDISFFRYHGRH